MEVRQKLPEMAPDDSPFDPPYSTSSICGLHSGIAHNVIPNKASVDWEMRVVQDSDRDYLRKEMQSYIDKVLLPEMRAASPKANISETVCREIHGLLPEQDGKAARTFQELTGANTSDVVAFATEAGLFQRAGVSTIVCGPGSISQAHKPDEYVSVDQLEACLRLLRHLGDKLV
jgi:acetylornithine deacetylase